MSPVPSDGDIYQVRGGFARFSGLASLLLVFLVDVLDLRPKETVMHRLVRSHTHLAIVAAVFLAILSVPRHAWAQG